MKSNLSKIFYLHIPKSGGTTLYHILDRIYKGSEQFYYSTIKPQKSINKIHNMSKSEKNKLKLIKGHFVFGFHDWFNTYNPSYFTIMRNPVDRVISHYHYSARKKITICTGKGN